MSLGPGMLPQALRLHWLCAYAFMLERYRIHRRVDRRRGMARTAAPPERSARRIQDVPVLHRTSVGKIGAPPMAPSAFRHKVQRAPARGILRCSAHGMPFGRYGMGRPQEPMQFHSFAAIFGGFDAAHGLAFLAYVGLHPFRRAPSGVSFWATGGTRSAA